MGKPMQGQSSRTFAAAEQPSRDSYAKTKLTVKKSHAPRSCLLLFLFSLRFRLPRLSRTFACLLTRLFFDLISYLVKNNEDLVYL